ncbi:hypothetical protein [Nocardia takedensis]|uniref:hypothetical protein n=1 Tax=Nocardia takedensis TaxID=259390 RepID=UPI0015756754|nr:hypothetical protein [Nocardia takedensis]
MARVVFVHGIGAQLSGEPLLTAPWLAALNGGLTRAGADRLLEHEVAFAFYGDLFRPPGEWLSLDIPYLDARDVDPGWEQDLLTAWWRHAAATDPEVTVPGDESLVAVPSSIQTALYQLARAKFFAGLGERLLIWNLKQVRRYFTDSELRERVRARLRACLAPDTRVVVAHSLGSVVAYETLCATTDHPVRALLTLGSPLGIPNLVFDRLEPAPVDRLGAWPGPPTLEWSNISDAGDIVALVKDLRPHFGPALRNALVHNGSHAHDATAYLTDRLTGEVVARGLL